MNQARDNTIEALLRKQFDGPVPDEDFSQRVMHHLPRRRRATWPLWGGVLAGAGGSWLTLSSSPLLRTAWRDLVRNDWSAPAITVLLVMLGMAMLALSWGVAETMDD